MSSGGLETRIREMTARGYRVHSRGARAAVLTRGPQRSRRLARLIGLGASIAALLFGLWRASWLFAAVGLVGVLLTGLDGWAARSAMTVRLTVDDSGRVIEQLIRSGDEA